MMTRILGLALVLFAAAHSPALAQPCCLLPDNGAGTVDLPPDCPPDGYVGGLELIEGLPEGGTVTMDARLTGLVLVATSPGGSLGGTVEEFTATMIVDLEGAGTLAGFNRTLHVPVTGETHTAPRTPGDAVQSVPFEVYRLQGILRDDYDFRLLWFEGGAYYGLPSPGHTTLVRQGGPGSDFAAASAFHYFYRIQFDGRQESEWIEGFRGTTLDLESDFALCPSGAALGIAGETPLRPVVTAAPNPSRSSVSIGFALAGEGRVRVDLFDLRGALIRTLLDARLGEGRTSVTWDGRDGQGRFVPEGVYHARILHPGGVAGARIVIIR